MSKRAAKKTRDLLWQTTAEVIREWDPLGLLASGSPIDEFDSEISSVVAQVPRIHSARDAAHAVSRVFSSSFDRSRFAPEGDGGGDEGTAVSIRGAGGRTGAREPLRPAQRTQ